MPKKDRVILHCDGNGFFASVELLDRPDLKNVPMAVAGDPENRHGIILAKNEIAKRYGIETAEPIWQAKRKCPNLVCVPPHHDKYMEISRRVNKIYLDYTDLVEPFSVDESFLDITGSLHLFGKPPRAIADEIRRRVREEIGITISVGVSFCRVFAKLGSDYKKPDATTEITRENLPVIVYPLPVSALLYAGEKTTEALAKIGIHTVGQLADAQREDIRRLLGEAGDTLWRYARGLDEEAVRPYGERREVKSVGNGMTFRRDIQGEIEVRAGVAALADSVASRLRGEGKRGACVQIAVKDPNFKVRSKQCTLAHPTWLQKEITDAAMRLLREMRCLHTPIRLITITVTSLIDAHECTEQLSLFDEESSSREKQEKLESLIADIRSQYGAKSIRFGYFEDKETGIR